MKIRDFVHLAIAVMVLFIADPALRAETPPPPLVEVTIPLYNGLNPASRTPVATYEWQTLAGSTDPAEILWIMVPLADHNNDWNETIDYIRSNPAAPEWSAWQPYSPPSAGTSWTSPPLDIGLYMFAVHGRDSGGITDDLFFDERNLRRVVVSLKTTGPALTVTGELIDDIVTTVTTTTVTEVGVAGNTPLVFCWEATAEDYGLPVTGYRYGWDVLDPDDDNAWPMPFTPFGQTVECSPGQSFANGTHLFQVEVIDYDGFKSRVPIRVQITAPTPVESSTWGRIKSLYKR
jgi:hypothetical protein